MKTHNLFKVLVLGGALLSAGSVFAESETEDLIAGQIEAEGMPAFCGKAKPDICEADQNGKMVAKEGLTCCWGTSCDDE